jgi:hypothetical protein
MFNQINLPEWILARLTPVALDAAHSGTLPRIPVPRGENHIDYVVPAPPAPAHHGWWMENEWHCRVVEQS